LRNFARVKIDDGRGTIIRLSGHHEIRVKDIRVSGVLKTEDGGQTMDEVYPPEAGTTDDEG